MWFPETQAFRAKESIEEYQRHLPDSSDGCLECGYHIFHKEVATIASFFCYGFSCSCIYKSGQKKSLYEYLTTQYIEEGLAD